MKTHNRLSKAVANENHSLKRLKQSALKLSRERRWMMVEILRACNGVKWSFGTGGNVISKFIDAVNVLSTLGDIYENSNKLIT